MHHTRKTLYIFIQSQVKTVPFNEFVVKLIGKKQFSVACVVDKMLTLISFVNMLTEYLKAIYFSVR